VPGVVQPGIISILLLLYYLYLTCRILLAADLVLAELTLLTGLELACACACVRSFIMGQTLPVEVPISAKQIILTQQQFWLLFCIVWLIDRNGWNNDWSSSIAAWNRSGCTSDDTTILFSLTSMQPLHTKINVCKK
jgi:hypothetical protein